eukprot:Nitzschia sp. Nitz4//scaffold6_size259037//196602//197885//NITZ4_001104-RA/size259037-augustus-gene-0.302-mRNA-1//1//CDS//3329556983//6924//frame0
MKVSTFSTATNIRRNNYSSVLVGILLLTAPSSFSFAFSLVAGPAFRSLAHQNVHSQANGMKSTAKFQHESSMTNIRSRLSVQMSASPTEANAVSEEAKISSEPANEWGIPSSSTLRPLSPFPVKQLPNKGRVTLVGSGPGDPELLTLKAHSILADPNALIICDRLISDEIVSLIKGEVKTARKLPGCAELAQEEIYWWVHQGLEEGRHVVRLKIGDPFVFGRGGEEILKFREFGVESVVIPGVSSAISAPLLGNIPVTHRGVSNQVVMCTGYGREGTSPDLIRYHKEQTVVFLMAVGRLRELCERLVRLAGFPETTPVGIVERAGCPTQRVVVGTIATIGGIAEREKVQAPATIVVGDVVNVLLEEGQMGIVAEKPLKQASFGEEVSLGKSVSRGSQKEASVA